MFYYGRVTCLLLTIAVTIATVMQHILFVVSPAGSVLTTLFTVSWAS